MSQTAVAQPLAGRISTADVEVALSNARCHVPNMRRLRRARLRWAFKRERYRVQLATMFVANAMLLRCRQLRGLVDRSAIWKEGLLVCGTAFATGLSIVTVVFITNDTSLSLISGCLGATVGIGALYGLLYARMGTFDAIETTRCRQSKKMSEFRRSEVVRELASVRRLYESAFARYLELKRTVESRIHRLLTCDWPSLRGIPFESFLAQVFLELGFDVELTKASGDQGADLIAEGSGRRIAIQAKGWQDAVGNHAVQEVHAGMTYYGCSRCMVITNSTFTHAAVDLASKIGCLLIDGSQIEALIRGQIAV